LHIRCRYARVAPSDRDRCSSTCQLVWVSLHSQAPINTWYCLLQGCSPFLRPIKAPITWWATQTEVLPMTTLCEWISVLSYFAIIQHPLIRYHGLRRT
jgi:hypothetical protein